MSYLCNVIITRKIYGLLQSYYNIQCGVGFYGSTLLDFLAFDNGLQPAIDYSYRVFGNPVFVFDANYNLIAAPFEKLKDQNFTDRTLEKKGFTDQDLKWSADRIISMNG